MLTFPKIAGFLLIGLLSVATLDAVKSRRKNSCEKTDIFENIDKHIPEAIKNCELCFPLISEKIGNHEEKEVRLDQLATLIGQIALRHRQGHPNFSE